MSRAGLAANDLRRRPAGLQEDDVVVAPTAAAKRQWSVAIGAGVVTKDSARALLTPSLQPMRALSVEAGCGPVAGGRA